MAILLSKLADHLNAEWKGPDVWIDRVSIDTRTLRPGDLFLAIVGERFDGHTFIQHAQAQGAKAVVIQKPVEVSIPFLKVSNTRQALIDWSGWHRSQFSLPIIAVTGSCGKTTTKEMLSAILSQCGSVLASPKSFNNPIGLPLALLNLEKKYNFAVIEIGGSYFGEIRDLAQLTRPKVALITCTAAAHLEGFGSLEGVAQAKAEIFSGLSDKGIAILNADDPFYDFWKNLLPPKQRIFSFGIQNEADYTANSITVDAKGTVAFQLNTPKGNIFVQLPLLGQHNVINALAAAASSMVFGISLQAVKTGLESLSSLPRRLTIKQAQSGIRILDDTYNANPGSVKAALQVLGHQVGKRIFVFGGMKELGLSSDEYHEQIGHYARTLGIEHVFTCGELTHSTAKAFGDRAQYFPDQLKLIEALFYFLRTNLETEVTILVKGSLSTDMDRVVAALELDKVRIN